MGNRLVTLAANILFNVYLHDLMTCHKAIRTELFKSLPLLAKRLHHRTGDSGPVAGTG